MPSFSTRCATLFHQLDGAWMQFATGLVQEERDRYAPVALARDAPVGTPGDHSVQARLAPARDEFGLGDGFQRSLAQGSTLPGLLVHADEPLRGGAIDQRRLVPPAVHVAVIDGFVGQQAADLFQLGHHVGVGLPDELAAEERQRVDVDAVALHRAEDVVVAHPVALAGIEVVFAVGRRRVDDTGAGIEGHVVGQVDRRQALVERMAEVDQFQRLALGGGDHLALALVARQAGLDQGLGQHQVTIAGIDQRVVDLRMHVQRLVGRDGPGRGGPDDDLRRLVQGRQAEGRGQLVGIRHREADVDGRRLLVGVLDLGLGQRRTTVEAPVDRLQALEHEVLLDHFREGADFVRLVGEIHGLVGVVPLAEHAQADEVGLLPFDLLGCVFAAQFAGLVRRKILAVGGLDLVLDGQAVAIPARHIGRVVARQGLGADNDVLENLVDRVTDVNAAVGVRRAIVQDELRTVAANGPQLLVQTDVVPELEGFRLALGQAGFHWEGGFRKV